MSLLVVGTIGIDTIETPFGSAENTLGGSAMHFAAAASLYAPVNLVSVIGVDLKESDLDFLRQRHVDTRGVTVAEGLTFRWSGRYGYDMNSRETLETQLNVFADFQPTLPDDYRASKFVFLANMDPKQQRAVLEQVREPTLTMMDTMDLWIRTQRDELVATMRLVDMVTINDSEIRMFAGINSIVAAARQVLDLGPRAVLVKKGENGAVMFTKDNQYFAAPAYPLEDVRDPTGAGDSFAGGFIGYLEQTGNHSPQNLRRAVIYGSIVASFAVESFSITRLQEVTPGDIAERYDRFRRMIDYH